MHEIYSLTDNIEIKFGNYLHISKLHVNSYAEIRLLHLDAFKEHQI